jgi:hypothetical protein
MNSAQIRPTKRCSKCALELPRDAFNLSRKEPCGLESRCKQCRSEDRAAKPRAPFVSLDGEEWKTIPGFEVFYEASNLGRVRSLMSVQGPRLVPRLMRTKTAKSGYIDVTLQKPGTCVTVRVHRVVLEAFVGMRPAGMECRHLDGNPANNTIDNIVWGTRAENCLDRRMHGRVRIGTAHTNSKLNESSVVAILRRFAAGEKQRDIAKRHGVSHGLIGHICSGKTWKHVPRP